MPMRPRGNHVKVEGVLVSMLAVIAALAAYFIISVGKEMPGAVDLTGNQTYVESPSINYGTSDAPVNHIGAQHSSQQQSRNRKLNSQMIQFLDLRHVE